MLNYIMIWISIYFALIVIVTIIIKIWGEHSKIKINYINKLDDSKNKESKNWVEYLKLTNSIQNDFK